LRLLAAQPDYSLSASVLVKAARELRHAVFADVIEADLVRLEEHGLVTREVLAIDGAKLTMATLTRLGLDVSQGRQHPLVARPSPKS
ncbi:hypothetical protein, partial [Rhodoplanes sp. SY1]|uniref:hypothetical protein n=1 Tax=Rhodoplanes sp. SY1 TaxID=3166646 RepID=UPI0038B44EBD